jgi:uncharacterized membrane protein (DUF485 family)
MKANLWDSSVTFRRSTVEKASFVLLNQFDLTLTVLAMYFGFSELNPFVKHLVNMPILLLVIKLVIPLIIAWLIPGKLLLPSIALLILVIIWNVKELVLFLF